MLNFTYSRALRIISATVLGAAMLFQAQVSQAGPSQTVFSFSGPSNATSLQVTAGGVTTIVATSRGWYETGGASNGATATNNYIVGLCGTDACNEADLVSNNWFVFPNLAAGAPITAASLLLDVPPNSATPGFISNVPSLSYTIFDVSTPIANLGTPGAAIFTDLGTGVVFGQRTYTAADMGTTTTVPLNAAAIAYLNANRGANVAFGGAIAVVSTIVPVLDNWQTLTLMAAAMLLIAGFAFRFRNKF